MNTPTTRKEMPLADLTGAEVHSLGWIPESPLTFSVWYTLSDGATAIATYELGGADQDQRARVVCGPDR